MNAEDMKERRIAWAILIICPLSVMLMFVYVTLGYARGLAAGHPMEYLQMTCILWAIIMTVLPILRLVRLVSLPLWFMVLIYGDMYLFVLTLCEGLYFDISWWADFTHVISSMVIASIVFLALCSIEASSPSHVTLGSRGGIVMVTVFVAFSFGAIWEVMEGFTDILTGIDYMSYGALHTMGNLTADMIGTMIMATIAWMLLDRYGVKGIASKIRLGRKKIDDGR
jgi:hypothetical protein